MGFLSDLLSEYGRPVDSYTGHGTLWAKGGAAEVEFTTAQYADGRVLLAIQGAQPAFDVAIAGPVKFEGTAEEAELSTSGQIAEVTMLQRPPAGSIGVWAVFQLQVLHVSHPASGPPSSIRYLLTNLELDVAPGDGEMQLVLPGEDSHVVLQPLANVQAAHLRLRALKAPQVTAYLTVYVKDAGVPKARTIANRICYLLSIARGTKVQWVREDLFNAEGGHTHTLHGNRVTKPFSTFAPIDPLRIRGTRRFIESTYTTFAQRCQGCKLDSGTIDSVLDAKVEGDFLEMRGAKLAVALETLKENVLRVLDPDVAFVVPPNEFSRIVAPLSALVRRFFNEAGIGSAAASSLSSSARLTQLNRHSFAKLLRRVARLLQLDVPYRDLELVVKSRNSLVHRGDFYCATASEEEREAVPPKPSSFDEYIFLLGLLDRLLLRLIDYRGPYLVRTSSSEWEERHL